MKAIVLREYGGPEKLKLEVVEDPKPAAGEVLVEMAATSVNPFDWKVRAGMLRGSAPLEFPAVLGLDIAGTVKALGAGVTDFAVGDRVFGLGAHTYAELVAVKAANLAKAPDGLDLTQAAALPLVTLTGEQLISRGVKPRPGQTVLVAGAAGSVGRSAVYTAKQAGAKVIAGVKKEQVQVAAELGADQVVALDDADAVARLGEVDAIADTVNGDTAARLLSKVKQGGVFASVLGPPKNAQTRPDVRVEAVRSGPDAKALRRLAEAVAAGKLKIPVAKVLPLAQADEAQRETEQGVGKIVLAA